MEIRIGKFTLKSDRFCAWIEQEVKTEKGKSRHQRITGYYRDFGLLLDNFIDLRTKDSEASELKQVLAEIESATKDAKKIAREAYKGKFALEERGRK